MSQGEVGNGVSEVPSSSLTEHPIPGSSVSSSSSSSNGNNIQSEIAIGSSEDYVNVIGEGNGGNINLTGVGGAIGMVTSAVGINEAGAGIVIGESATSVAARTGTVEIVNPGTIQGSIQGPMQGALHGSIQGTMQGPIQGSIQEPMQGSIQGQTQGSIQGPMQGQIQGLIQGQMQGAVPISVPITIQGSGSNVIGSVEGTGIVAGTGGNVIINNNDKMSEMMAQKEKVYQYLVDLTNSSKREMALSKLSKYRETFPDLAPLMWHSFGCIAALLQEIISIYPLLSPPSLSNQASNRTCNCLALLQCIASHPETRGHFLSAQIPLYLYPFLNTVTKSRPFEYLRLTSLGVIGALVKVDDPEIVSFLLQTEIIPLCLRVMETGSELSKTVSTFIIQKILLDDMGLSYICATPERFFTVCQVLGNVITQHNEAPSPRLLKHIIRCYLRLSENQKVREPLKQTIPPIILTSNFKLIFHDDVVTTKWLHQLYANIC
ncbi:cell differentiation rcd1 [Cryptosporidium bovis]|uniref:cell differentiation rcd1 n=1 Tax=Cryptosporidium bovis TaxID=310047 RepID=UPI00351A3DB3|nr:cell differentiation rcd1 [Cryptosporidium bovis]